MSKKKKTPTNPHVRHGRIIVRVSVSEMKQIIESAFVHSRGNVSAWAREALLKFTPPKESK